MEKTSEYDDFPLLAEIIVRTKQEVERKKKQEKKEQSKIKLPSDSKPAPKQGHHIINKGVINIYEDIIRWFVRDNEPIFKGISYDDLKAKEMTTKHDEEKKALDFLKVQTPLSKNLRELIKDTTVSEKNQTGVDNNAVQFGLAKLILIACTEFLMSKIYVSLCQGKERNKILRYGKRYFSELQCVIERYFKLTSPKKYEFVDHQAWEEWKKEATKTKQTKIENCMGKVREMIEDIAKCEKKELEQTIDVTPLVFKWGEGAFWVPQVLLLE